MGCDTKIMLPGDVAIRDVAKVIGILAGLEVKKELRHDSEYWTAKVDGVEIKQCSSSFLFECCTINLKTPEGKTLIDDERSHYVMYFFEGDEYDPSSRILCPPSTDFWIAIGRGLCQFFGGKIDYNDCDDVDIDAEFNRPRRTNRPLTDDEHLRFQEEMLALKPAVLNWMNVELPVVESRVSQREENLSDEEMNEVRSSSPILGELFD